VKYTYKISSREVAGSVNSLRYDFYRSNYIAYCTQIGLFTVSALAARVTIY